MACPLIISLQNCYITKQTFQQKSNLGCKIYFANILWGSQIVLGKMRNCVMQKVNVERKMWTDRNWYTCQTKLLQLLCSLLHTVCLGTVVKCK